MDDDLNTPEALSVLFDLANALNRETSPDSEPARRLASTLRKLGDRLGILQSDPQAVLQGVVSGDSGLSVEAIDALIAERVAARAQKDFARSDEIRDLLARQGVQLEDAGGKTSWRRT
jgi:cysteinyl-tRNA synthetase